MNRGKQPKWTTASARFNVLWAEIASATDPSAPDGGVVNGRVETEDGGSESVLVWAHQLAMYNRDVTPPTLQAPERIVSAIFVDTEEVVGLKSADVFCNPSESRVLSALGKLGAITFEETATT